jgi:hypothetical protein
MEALFGMQCPRHRRGHFFAGLTAKRQRKAAVASSLVIHVSPKLTITGMEDPSSELSSLFKYPNIVKLHVKLNTGLPCSQCCRIERLFSPGGRVFTPLRANMTSEHFEMFFFLRAFDRGL